MKLLVVIFLAVVFWWLFAAAAFPILQDEAYYLMWSKYLSFGYFDHPPFVAWVASAYNICKTAFCGRLGVVIMATMTMLVAMSFYKRIFRDDLRLLKTSVAILMFSLAGLISGFLLTPDTPMLFFWILIMHEVYAAYLDESSCSGRVYFGSVHWLTSGLFFGLGLLAKYMMVLMAPIVCLTLLVSYRKAFLRPAFYLGILLSIIAFSPNLFWNATHDWMTFKFQMKHGFSLEKNLVPIAQDLPKPDLMETIDDYWDSMSFVALDVKEKKFKYEEKSMIAKPIAKTVERLLGFLGAQIAFFGCFAFVGMYHLIRNRNRLWTKKNDDNDFVWWLCVFVTACPVLFFGLISLFSKVEANWGVMFIFGAVPLVAPLFLNQTKTIITSSLVNLSICLILLVSIYVPAGVLGKIGDRLLRESSGYIGLSKVIHDRVGPDEYVFSDTYQTASMISFYSRLSDSNVNQWPGITRPSELVVNRRFASISKEDILAKGSFVLLTSEERPEQIPGFKRKNYFQVRNCFGQYIDVVNLEDIKNRINTFCEDPIHKWYVIRYSKGRK